MMIRRRGRDTNYCAAMDHVDTTTVTGPLLIYLFYKLRTMMIVIQDDSQKEEKEK